MKLTLLVAVWLAGLLLGLRMDVGLLPLFLLVMAAPPLGWLLHLGGYSVSPVVLAGVLLLGLLHVEGTDAPPAPLVTQDGHHVSLQGWVISDPEATAQSIKLVLAVEAIDRGNGWYQLRSKVLAYADPPASLVSIRESPYFRYGDAILMQGSLERPQPFEGFDYPSFLARQGIQGVMRSQRVEFQSQEHPSRWRGWIFDLRHELSERIEAALPVSHSSLAEALLLGLRGRMPEEVKEDFLDTGTSHLLAISGLNVGMVLLMSINGAAWLLGRRKQLYLLLPLVSIWVYALISGLHPPVERAAIMGSVYLAALALGRPRSVVPALAFGAAVMATVDPQVLMQVDFQLSFAAVAGIALAVPYQARIVEAIAGRPDPPGARWRPWRRYVVSWIVIATTVSVAATLATLPLVAFNFHRIPLFGIIATVLSLPVQPIILLGSLATALGGLVHPAVGQVFGWLSWVPLSYQLGLVSLVPGGGVSGSWIGGPLVWGWCILLGLALLLPGGFGFLKNLPVRWVVSVWRAAISDSATARPNGAALGFLGLALVMAVAGIFWWLQVFSRPDGKLHVYFFDVGQGDSMFIVTPGGRQVLVDGGPDAESATRALAGPLPFWDRSLDLVVLTHLDADHSRGLLEVLDRYHVSAVLVGQEEQAPEESGLYPQWRAMLERQDLQVIQVSMGYRVVLEGSVTLEVLNPSPTPFQGSSTDRNNNGVVLRLVYGEVSFLLAADIQSQAESYLVRNAAVLESTVLKVAHHGSGTSSGQEFLRRVNPSRAVISVGAGNRFGHPHPEVVARLEQVVGVAGVYQTARQGTIQFISDGRQLSVRTQR